MTCMLCIGLELLKGAGRSSPVFQCALPSLCHYILELHRTTRGKTCRDLALAFALVLCEDPSARVVKMQSHAPSFEAQESTLRSLHRPNIINLYDLASTRREVATNAVTFQTIEMEPVTKCNVLAFSRIRDIENRYVGAQREAFYR